MDLLLSVRNLVSFFRATERCVRWMASISTSRPLDPGPDREIRLREKRHSAVDHEAAAAAFQPDHRRRGTFLGHDLVPLEAQAMRAIRGKQISMIFQDPMTSLNPVITVGNQVIEAILLHERVGRKTARARAIEMIGLVGIPSPELRMDQYPFQLSGGMRQRIMIAMALCCGPILLLADEPTTALDVTVQAQILDLMATLQRKFEMGVLLITHDLGIVAHYSDEVAVMYGGKIVERATTAALFQQPRHPYTQGLMDSIPGEQPPKARSMQFPVPSRAP